MKKVAIINTCAPFSLSHAKDSLDIALILGSYEQDVHLYFIDDGVWQLKAEQNAEMLKVKDFLKTFAAFEFYDIDTIFACQQSLAARDISSFNIEAVKQISQSQIAKQLQHYDSVLTF